MTQVRSSDRESYATMIVPPARSTFDLPPQVHDLATAEEAEPYLVQLEEMIPRGLWMVVVDGRINDFAAVIAESAYQRGRLETLIHVTTDGVPDIPAPELTGIEVLDLNRRDSFDRSFLEGLPADLVVVPSREKHRMPAMDHWTRLARFVLREVAT